MTSLLKATNETIANFGKYNPETIELLIEQGQKQADNYRTIKASLQFFVQEYTGKDKESLIAQVEAELIKCQHALQNITTVQTLAVLNKIDRTSTEKCLMVLINDLRLYFQFDNMISTDGIKSICPMIIAEYPGLSLEEITICFSQAKKGHYGELYNRLDGFTIFKFLKTYSQAKIERIKIRQDNQYRQNKYSSTRENSASRGQLLSIAYAAVDLQQAQKNK